MAQSSGQPLTSLITPPLLLWPLLPPHDVVLLTAVVVVVLTAVVVACSGRVLQLIGVTDTACSVQCCTVQYSAVQRQLYSADCHHVDNMQYIRYTGGPPSNPCVSIIISCENICTGGPVPLHPAYLHEPRVPRDSWPVYTCWVRSQSPGSAGAGAGWRGDY